MAQIGKVVLSPEQEEGIKNLIKYYTAVNKKRTEEMCHHVEVGSTQPPIVYIAEYTTYDDYGALREQDVFSKEEDAWAFVLQQRSKGATDISVKSRLVYASKDREGFSQKNEKD